LLLAIISCAVTVWAQSEALAPGELFPLPWRMGNALVSYAAYLGRFFWPLGLAVYYPHPGANLPAWKVLGALLVLVSISAAALIEWRRRPYLLVGWLWYLGMLMPVIGLVQVGGQAMAGRYTYLTQIGLGIALAWAAADVCRSRPARRWVCGLASALLLAILTGCAWRQTSFWYDAETLWTHALTCTPPSCMVHYSLGNAFHHQNRFQKALVHYQEALKIKPDHVEVCNNIGKILLSQGRPDEAVAQYQKALKIDPKNILVRANLGNALIVQKRFDEAMTQYRAVLDMDPNHVLAHRGLADILHHRGRLSEAIAHYRKVLDVTPDDDRVHYSLGMVLQAQGEFGEAMTHYRDALTINPDHAVAHNNLAWLGATCPEAAMRNGAEAIAHARQADRLCGGKQPDVLDTLAAALAEAGRFPEALATARKALDLAAKQNNRSLAGGLRTRIALYEAGKPYRQPPSASVPPPPKP
jgi:tetratricopeptide (TPR) repeat protein